MCPSGYNRRNRPVGDLQKDLLQGIGLCDSGSSLGKCEIHTAGLEEGRPRTPVRGPSPSPQVEFLFRRSLSSVVKAFPLLKLSRIIALV